MVITYIHHSSFLAELSGMYLLFDYTEGEIPPLKAEKPLLVFASHRHGDHFSPRIFDLAKSHPLIRYVLSDDIFASRIPAQLDAVTDQFGPGEIIRLELPGRGKDMPDAGEQEVEIHTFRSTDEGVAFLIAAEGSVIYHAGDLNDWVWEGEPEEDNRKMHEAYMKELRNIADTKLLPDVAFVPLDPRQEQDFYLGMDEFMHVVGAKTVFPMHFWGDFSVTAKLRALPCAESYHGQLVELHYDGETFQVQ